MKGQTAMDKIYVWKNTHIHEPGCNLSFTNYNFVVHHLVLVFVIITLIQITSTYRVHLLCSSLCGSVTLFFFFF